jgi:hypothetical protein
MPAGRLARELGCGRRHLLDLRHVRLGRGRLIATPGPREASGSRRKKAHRAGT